MVVYSGQSRGNSQQSPTCVTGNLLFLLDEGMRFLAENLKPLGRVGTDRRDDLEIPRVALREALVNALVHREYEKEHHRKQPCRIEVYPDRVVITSYGPLVQGVRVEALNRNPEEIVPHRRNENIARVFRIGQKAELNAGGISRMWHESLNVLLPCPRVTADEESVAVTFRPGAGCQVYSMHIVFGRRV